MSDRLYIAFQQTFVDPNRHIPRRGRIHIQEDVYLASADMLLYQRFDHILGKQETARKTNGAIQIAVIHTFELHVDIKALNSPLGAAVAGHAFDHTSSVKRTISKLILSLFFFVRWLATKITALTSSAAKLARMLSPSLAPAREARA